MGQATAEWTGEWVIEFWGETERGRLDAQRVAAAIRHVPSSTPVVQDILVNSVGDLKGFLYEGLQGSGFIPYEDTALHFAPADAQGALFYPTRSGGTGYLTPEPIALDDLDNSFAVTDIGMSLVEWDAEYDTRHVNESDCQIEGGGKLNEALTSGGSIWLHPRLERSFRYGPEVDLRYWSSWTTEAADVSEAFLAARDRADAEALQPQVEQCLERQRLEDERRRSEEERLRLEQERQVVIQWLESLNEDTGLLPSELTIVPTDAPTRPSGTRKQDRRCSEGSSAAAAV